MLTADYVVSVHRVNFRINRSRSPRWWHTSAAPALRSLTWRPAAGRGLNG